MRRLIVPVIATLLATTACVPAWAHDRDVASSTLAQCHKIVPGELYAKNRLTVATDNPVNAPWFINNTPSNQMGFESALTYAIANALGFKPAQVSWVTEPFATSLQPGSKDFDFDINEITVTPSRAQSVEFSAPYYQLQQSLVALKSSSLVKKNRPADLRNAVLGALVGSPGYAYATRAIAPKSPVKTFTTLNDAVRALENKSIDAIVVDTPTGNLLVNWQILSATGQELATQVGQFPADGTENYGLLLQLKNPLVGCINTSLSSLSGDGTMTKLTKKWLQVYTSVPTLAP